VDRARRLRPLGANIESLCYEGRLSMTHAHAFLTSLAVVLCVAAVTTVLFHRLRQPVVLGYLIAGLIIGPHVPIPLVADVAIVQTLSELGVILLMFSLGLEFSLSKLLKVGLTAGLTAFLECSAMVWLGFVVGRLFGWSPLESLFTGAIVAISSTTIIARAFQEQRVSGTLRHLVFGALIIEDLIAILLMASLTALSSGSGLSADAFALTAARLVAFLLAFLAGGLLVVPRLVRAVVRLGRPETTLVSSLGLCFALALLAQEFGYSVALGAFLAGSLVAESGEEKHVEHLIQPVRDVFGAVFFVSVGMLIDPSLVARHWTAIGVLATVVILGKILAVSLGAFLTGHGTRTSIEAGMSMAQIGEFSFIIAALGLSLKATGEFLYPVAVAVSALTTLTTPWLIRAAGPTASFVDRSLPRPLQTFAVLYGTWVERLREAPRRDTLGSAIRRFVRRLLIDTAFLVALVIGGALSLESLVLLLKEKANLAPTTARPLVVLAVLGLAAPFCVGMVRVAGRLGGTLADAALPPRKDGRVDLAAAPRRALVVTLQLAIALAVGIPTMALTQPFLPGVPLALVLLAVLTGLGVGFWRSAANLHGHVRAGAEMIVEALAAQSRARVNAQGPAPTLAQVDLLLPGLGAPTPVELRADSPAVGRTLAELNLRGLTGATVLAISRGTEGVLVPTAQEALRVGDVLAVAGTHEAIDAAQRLLSVVPVPLPLPAVGVAP
jgi:CPA2 family monovalent cation:H+ antiporter-2